MPILAIDTATLVSGVAIVENNKLLAEITLQTKLTHSEVLMPHIQQAMSMAKVSREQLEAVAVSIGPGSFTGLRIGLATAKTLAYALNIPIVGVSTLEALAYNCQVIDNYIVPTLDAQKGNVYAAQYLGQADGLQEIIEPHVIGFAELLEKVRTADKPVILLGEGAIKNRQAVQAAGGSVHLAGEHNMMPRAASVAFLGLKALREKRSSDVMTLEPYYIRRSEAEVLWEKRNGIQ